MEIEAKFALPDIETFERLRAADHLAGLVLSAGQIKQVRDTYLDTADRLILAAGYACRRREQSEGLLMTLKGLRGAQGAVHRREELEVWLPADQPPAAWPPSPARDQVLRLIGEAPLAPLLDLQQTRIVRSVNQGERLVAELSLDEVHVTAQDRHQAYFELEVELAPQGSEDDLAAIVTCLQDEWGLKPELHSKFERALAFLEESHAENRLLTPPERAICQRIAQRGDSYGWRALALLALDEGATQNRAGEQAGLSARRVRYWLAEFRKQRPGIFPDHVLDTAQPASPSAPPEATAEPAPLPAPPASPVGAGLAPDPLPEPGPAASPQPLPLEVLFQRYQVDRTHARTVADHALAMFDHLRPLHGLPPEQRPLLEMAALVHNVGLETDPIRHHSAGRDILLAHPPSGLDDHERLALALSTFLHRKRITAKKLGQLADSPFAALPEPMMSQALALAALVRLADGLDYSQTSSSQIGQVQPSEGVVEIEVTGPYAPIDADRAQAKSDLWRLLFAADVRFKPAPTAEMAEGLPPPVGAGATPALPAPTPAPAPEQAIPPMPTEQPSAEAGARLTPTMAKQAIHTIPVEMPAEPGLEEDDPMAEAARKTLNFHFQRMLVHEPATRLGEDIEALHDMRVATRRMRAAFRLFGDYLDMEELAPIVKGLRRTGQVLGAVRDLDVFWEKTQHYLDALPPEQPADLGPLRRAWETQREQDREQMLAYLDSDRYARFKEQFSRFLGTPGAGALPIISQPGEPRAYRLRHVAPAALYQRLAAVQAYDEWVTKPDVPLGQLHQLRITAKGLRYALEFFQEVLGTEVKTLIDEVKALQDHLGDLQDAVVASNLLRDFLTWGTWRRAEVKKKVIWPTEPVIAPGVAAYLAARQVELQRLVATFPQVWARFQMPEFNQLVASAVAHLWSHGGTDHAGKSRPGQEAFQERV